MAPRREASLQHGRDPNDRRGGCQTAEPGARQPGHRADPDRKPIKAILTRFGIRRFRLKLRKAEQQLKELRTAEGSLLPENTCAELFRHLARLHIVREQIRAIEKARLQKLEADRDRKKSPHAMVHLIARVVGSGVETADMLVNEVFSRQFRDCKAVARYAGLTGSPDESGKRRREKGLARAGNARARTGMDFMKMNGN